VGGVQDRKTTISKGNSEQRGSEEAMAKTPKSQDSKPKNGVGRAAREEKFDQKETALWRREDGHEGGRTKSALNKKPKEGAGRTALPMRNYTQQAQHPGQARRTQGRFRISQKL